MADICLHPAWTEDDDCTLHCDHCGYCKPFDQDVDPDTVSWLPEQNLPEEGDDNYVSR